MSANNELLRALHMERLERLNNKIVDVPKIQDEDLTVQDEVVIFECPVCYTDGAKSGLVTPVCGHKICLACYSTMFLASGMLTLCPCCRRKYMAYRYDEGQEQEQADLEGSDVGGMGGGKQASSGKKAARVRDSGRTAAEGQELNRP